MNEISLFTSWKLIIFKCGLNKETLRVYAAKNCKIQQFFKIENGHFPIVTLIRVRWILAEEPAVAHVEKNSNF